ncbi:MAG TPA: ABC transporter ATP-binding protein [Acidimicrobiales bacterium]|nr:ABC transporter ATP-binding protein [Acidimicrobiales bacterium]
MSSPVLLAEHLSKRFDNGVLAVDDVSLTVHPGETVGIVGESGCGKSTTGKLILRLLETDSGYVAFDGQNLATHSGQSLRDIRGKLQLVPQNPQTSLNPRLSITEAIAFNLRTHGWAKRDIAPRAASLLDMVGVPASYAHRYPHELSGGQLQRVAIARALSTDPKLIVCDEAVSALDKSVQAQVLNLLVELQNELGIAYLFISHDLGVVEHLSHRVLVMYLGRIVEESTAADLWQNPSHPYTVALFSSVPGPGRERIVLSGELPSPANPPSGCGFRTRCPIAIDDCAAARPAPVTVSVSDHHQAACIRVEERVPVTAAMGVHA